MKYSIVLLFFILITSCQDKTKKTASPDTNISAQIAIEKSKGWELLFNGKNFNGWRELGRDTVQTQLWTIVDGSIKKINTGEVPSHADGQPIEGGDLMTIKSYLNYELYFEWKVLKAGNTGLKYNVSEEMSQKFGSKYSAIGFEYQLLDDKDSVYARKLKESQYTAALYDMIAPKNPIIKPAGEFNSSRIIVDGNHVEHWLNGSKVVSYEFGSSRLDSLYLKSKYHKIPDFHKKRKGHIILQNHKDEAWFRNLKIREVNNLGANPQGI